MVANSGRARVSISIELPEDFEDLLGLAIGLMNVADQAARYANLLDPTEAISPADRRGARCYELRVREGMSWPQIEVAVNIEFAEYGMTPFSESHAGDAARMAANRFAKRARLPKPCHDGRGRKRGQGSGLQAAQWLAHLWSLRLRN
jgi:hypothetical protein